METWYVMLTKARQRHRVPQTELAARAHVSLAAVKAYEQGKRHPSRPYLAAMLDCLPMERGERHAIFEAAGYAPDEAARGPWDEGFMLTLDQAAEEIASYPWPSFVTNELLEVCAANHLALALLQAPVTAEIHGRDSLGALELASGLDFLARIVNIDEAFGATASRYKGRRASMRAIREPAGFMRAAIDRFLSAGADRIAPYMRAWEQAEPIAPAARWSAPLVWEDERHGRLRFRATVSCVSHDDGLVINDWVPIDAHTCDAVAALAAGQQPHTGAGSSD